MKKRFLMRISLILAGLCALGTSNLMSAQTSRITGTITDEAAQPVIGAAILIKGSANSGTVTDVDGKFELSVPNDAVLAVSCIGYASTEVSVDGKSVINIVLSEDTTLLEEVVVVGYGTQKKVNLTGAVSAVKMEDVLGDRPVISVPAALQGAIPGLQITSTQGAPGAGMSYNIRGATSINGGSPLVLVNNVPMDLDLVDPQEIESVSVLKDAASAAIYGARAGFGVILITTKQGEKESPIKINYNNNFVFSSPLSLPQGATPLESVQAYKEMGWPNDIYVDGRTISTWENYIKEYNANPSKYPEGYVLDASNYYFMKEFDQFKEMMSNHGFQHNHNVSVSGGSAKTSYRVGVGYTDEDGILITNKDSYRRINVSTFVSTDIKKWLTVQADFRYINSNRGEIFSGGRGGVWGNALSQPSYYQTVDHEKDGVMYPAECSATYIKYGEPRKYKNNNLRALGRVIISPVKGLKITAEYTFNRANNYINTYENKYQFLSKGFVSVSNSVENSSYSVTQAYTNYHSINLFANYETTLASKHNLGATAGFSQESSFYEATNSTKTDVLLPNLPSLSGSVGTATVSDAFSEYAIRGLFFRMNYNYDNRYLIEVNGRYDGSSRFPKNSRFGFFPSASAAWRISNEPFMAGAKSAISNLKLRASYGAIGNQVLSNDYPYIPSMTPRESTWLVDGSKPTTLSTPNMVSGSFTWERVNNLDIGIDFGFLADRLSGTFDWYQRDTKGMLAPGMDLPWVIGADAPEQNAADLSTKGWELQISWKDQIGEVRYSLGFNLYDSKSVIKKYSNESKLLGNYYEGMTLGEIWGYTTDRFYTTADFDDSGNLLPGIAKPRGVSVVNPGDILYKDFDGDNEIYSGQGTVNNPGDRRVIGNSTPRYQYGITASIEWRGLALDVFFRGVGKRDYWRSDQLAWPTGGWGALYKETLDFWTPTNTSAFYPRVYANDAVNTGVNHWVQTKYLANAAFLSLQNVTLSYSLPKKWCDAIHFDAIKVYASGENLYTWDHLPEGLHPDMLELGDWKYPFMRKFSLGFNITF